MNTEKEMTVADTIVEQIGNRAFFMMGTRSRARSGNSLSFDVRGSKYNYVKVTLEPSDTYTVEAMYYRHGRLVRHEERVFVYAESLNAVIESLTGLRLSL